MSARLTRFSCANCGAPLAVGDFDLSVVCAYCRCGQKLNQESAQAHALEIMDRRNRLLTAETQELRLRADLRRIDNAWERFSRRYTRDSRDPAATAMTDIVSIFAGLSAVVICTFLSASYGPEGFGAAVIVGLGFCLFLSLRHEKRRATEYESYRSRYEQNRSNLLEKIQKIVAIRSTLH